MAAMKDTLAMIMAGGKGSRLGPLTLHRSKPAVPFAGQFRIIDFVLSNFINSGYRRIYLLTQYMASSLIKHLSRNWRLSGFGEYIEVVPAQMRLGEFWYRGTADAVYQNLNLVRDARPAHVCVFGGDHVYKFAVDQMDDVRTSSAAPTSPSPPSRSRKGRGASLRRASRSTIATSGSSAFSREAPARPAKTIPGRPDWSLVVSMGNYFFRAEVLTRTCLTEDAVRSDQLRPRLRQERHPAGCSARRRAASSSTTSRQNVGSPAIPSGAPPYWRDVGTLESYFRGQHGGPLAPPRDQSLQPSAGGSAPPSATTRPPASSAQGEAPSLRVRSTTALVCEGSIVASGGAARASCSGYDCFVHAGAERHRRR
jgi:glucose-1-phosphate adenylyltransferase